MTRVWEAPGRVNLIGEHVDYNDGLVLPFALPFVSRASVAARAGETVRLDSDGLGTAEFPATTQPGDVVGWAGYAAGVVWAWRESGLDVDGLEIAIESDVPVGAGLSSSAAICCSVAAAIADERGEEVGPKVVAEVARRAENDYVGAPTGVMDQLASMLGTAGHVTLLDCRSLETRQVPLDVAAAGLSLLLIDTKARHALVTGEYGDRRRECERAAAQLGVAALRDVGVERVASIDDPLLRRRARHVVTEIQRVRDVVEILGSDRAADIGDVLTASHESLRDDFEVSCDELDVAVDAALAAGALGARMTGGGFGGSAVALVRVDRADAVSARVRTAYRERDWPAPTIWEARPSQGAHRIG